MYVSSCTCQDIQCKVQTPWQPTNCILCAITLVILGKHHRLFPQTIINNGVAKTNGSHWPVNRSLHTACCLMKTKNLKKVTISY